MTTKTCLDCGNDFFYNPPLNYPDTRKYCDDCSAKRKASYQAAQKQPKPIMITQSAAQLIPAPVKEEVPIKPITSQECSQELKAGWSNVTKNINENPDSLEIGTPSKGGAIKIYGDFNEPEAFIVKFTNAKRVRDEANRLLMEIPKDD